MANSATLIRLLLIWVYSICSEDEEGEEEITEDKEKKVEGADGGGQETLFRVYVGNLKPNVEEGTLRNVFEEHGIVVGNVIVKRSFAFVDCPDQINVDKAIDRLNGSQFSGSEKMQVEPSVGRRRRSNKIQIRNFPSHVGVNEIQELVRTFGPVQKCDLVGAEGLVYVTFDNPDAAQEAVQRLNDVEFQGSGLKVDYANNRVRRPRMPNNNAAQAMNKPELPLKILVGSEFVGAIIGRQGQTIHNITQQSKARVDVHRTEHLSAPETVISIKGSAESCTHACLEIMKIVQAEAQSLIKGAPHEDLKDRDVPLKLLCPNNICGRLIGKGGSVIKGYMSESGTHIVVSSAADAMNYYVDRVITITGPVENASKAEGLISDKMRKCFERDMQNYNPNYGFQGGPGMGPMGPGFFQGGRGGPYQSQQYMGQGQYYPQGPEMMPPPPQEETETAFLYIPETAVGAVIGSKGTNIKNIMRLSSSRIKILPQKENEEAEGDKKMPAGRMEERKVIITGTPEAQWKAQFYIIEKIKTEVGFIRIADVHLRSEIAVPKPLIGRIIGKGGQHVKELQRVSGAIIKTPDTKNFPDVEEVPVTIIGHFYASQLAQRRIRALMSQAPPRRGPQQNGI